MFAAACLQLPGTPVGREKLFVHEKLFGLLTSEEHGWAG